MEELHMKKKKEDNSFQLLFTALVLVVIAVGGTLAWFASNSTSSVDQVGASITAPTDNDSFDGSEIKEWADGNYVNYGEGDSYYVPGMKRLFRAQVNSTVGRKLLFVMNGASKPALGSQIKIKFFDSDPTVNDAWQSDVNLPTDTLNSVAENVVNYGWSVVHTVPASQYVWFCLYMDESAGNTYQDLSFDFSVGVIDPRDYVTQNNE